jgi:cytochrome c553
MAQSILASKKTRGRPSTGVGTPVQVRLSAVALEAVDAWIARQPEPQLSRPEAIRRLVSIALRKDEQS